MKSRQLTKSPLTYVIAQVVISQIMQLEAYIPYLQKQIEQDFPLPYVLRAKTIYFNQLNEVGVKEVVQWHFVDKYQSTGIIIDENSITIHATQHEAFEILIKKFEDVLHKFNSILKITLCTRVGLRYINAIFSSPEKYLNKELLGFCLEKNGFNDKYFTKTEVTQETDCGMIKIKSSQYNDKNPIGQSDLKNFLIPSELLQSASYLRLNSDTNALSLNKFATLDIDHFSEIMGNDRDFDVEKITMKFNQLHKHILIAFESVVTGQAIKDWK